jgi:hypothetical protein
LATLPLSSDVWLKEQTLFRRIKVLCYDESS